MRAILTIGWISIAAAACAPDPGGDAGASTISVVASFYPLAEAAARVGGDCVRVTNLTPPGVEPHDLELTPGDVEAIVFADVVVVLGEGFQPAIDEAAAGAEGLVVDALAGIGTLPAPPEQAQEGLTVDPHVWLDPGRFAAMTAPIAAALEDAAAGAPCDFRAKAVTYREELEELDGEFRDGLARCDRKLMVTNHAAFGYLASAYGLRQEAIAGLEPEAQPSANHIAELKALVELEGVTTIFTETLVASDVAETLASEAGVSTAELHTLEGLSDDELAAGEDYRSIMRTNLETLRTALGCT